MVRIALALAATALASACRSQPPSAPVAPVVDGVDIPTRERIAGAEARRGGGLDELITLSRTGDPTLRALALRGLGRVGGARARAAMIAALDDKRTVVAAMSAIGLHASLHEPSPEVIDELSRALLSVRPEAQVEALALVEAVGRAGNGGTQKDLSAMLTSNVAELRAAAALALARHGRRKLALGAGVRLSLLDLVDDSDSKVRYAAVYAFAREHIVPSSPNTAPPSQLQNVGPALAARVANDEEASIRAVAAAALAKQDSIGAGHAALEKALTDTDWRVAVQAVRALAGVNGDDEGRDAVAAMVPARFELLVTRPDRGADAHVVFEALRLLGPHAKRPLVENMLTTIAKRSTQAKLGKLNASWVSCLVGAAQARTVASPSLVGLLACGLPEHLAATLVAELIAAGVGEIDARLSATMAMFSSDDPRTKAAALGVLHTAMLVPGMPAGSRAMTEPRLTAMLAASIRDKDPIVAGAAIEAVEVFTKHAPSANALVDLAILEAADVATDPEIAASLFGLIGSRKIERGRTLCREQLARPAVFAAAGRDCLRELGETVEVAPDPPPATVPALRLEIAAGLTWELTLEGRERPIRIELDPFTAPWAVASIIQLTEAGTYDGLAFHRVVPDFVVQGGDPTESGWGGPGYTLPAEPTAEPCFGEGGVGLADAGPDSAGSQWFVMHSRAPHLDARYTCFGRVIEDEQVQELQIGDRVQRARILRTAPSL